MARLVTPAGPPALAVRDIVRAFGARRVLDGACLEIAPGERRVLVGSNGAGKTTLFDVIGGLVAADGGTVRLSGRDITRLPPHERARRGLGRTFQVIALFGELTLRENLLLALRGASARRSSLWPLPVPAEGEAELLLDRWELSDRGDVPARLLSYGERRRADVLLAAAQRPAVLLLDEPTAGLSPYETALVVSAIRALPAGTAVLVTEHDLDVAARIGGSVCRLEGGRVVAA
ncbi:MAG: ATP-binding cassette domain-containing protein [Actinobacteria bacterium]|nr:ATP-binding cassette domain-containing protein [Actinomycetota bacterium]